jgi:Tol biopolymer transport system component
MRPFVARALAMALGLAFLTGTAQAQFFGQNKVQYRAHNWRILRTEHFDIHYYEGTEQAVHDAALMAERGYKRLSLILRHEIRTRTPIVLYASHGDFEQTNIIPELLGTGTGGVTEYLKRRVFLPFTGSYAELDHVLTHELVHAFQIDVLFGDRQSILSNPFASSPPGWFMEGMAEYLSIGAVDPNTKMWLRDAALEGYLIPIGALSYVGDIRVYRFGQSIFEFIADSYGIQKIGDVLKRVHRFGSVENALESSTGLSIDVLSKKWTESVRKAYLPDIAEYDRPDAIADHLTDSEHDLSNFNVAPAVSPDGGQVLFISDRTMYNDIYISSALDGRTFKKLASGQRTGSFETLRFFSTSMAWTPDGKRVAFPASAGGEDALYILQARSGRTDRKLKFGLDAIYSPTFSPDGKRVAFVGLKGGLSQLYAADVDGKNLTTLLESRYTVKDPAWSPDGSKIAFSTDEGPDTDLGRLLFGSLHLALYDLATGDVTVLPNQRGKNINPQWTPDGKALLFVSDRGGISNLYRIDLVTGQVSRLTHLLTGISGITPESPCISLSSDGRRLVFTTFSRGGWDVYSVREPERLYEGPGLAEPPAPIARAGAGASDEARVDGRLADAVGAATLQGANSVPGSTAVPPTGSAAALSAGPVDGPGVGPVRARAGIPGPAPADSAAPRDTTLTMMIDQVYRAPLVDSTTFVDLPYRAKFSRDYITGGALYSSNVGFAGQSILSFSDVLGNHNILAVLGLYGDIANSDVYLAYSNLAHRLNWGVSIFQFRNDLLLFSSAQADSVESQVYRGAGIMFARPFNRFRRVEFGLEAAGIDERVLEYNYELSSIREALKKGTFYYVAPSVGLVADDAVFGSTGAINGGRSRYTVEQALGDVQYTTLLMDWRRYTNLRQRFAIGQRLIAGTSFGRDPRYFRIGGPFTYRGADYGDLSLRGTHALLGNLEFRFPLIEQLRLGWPGRITLGGINGVAFLDAATVWSAERSPRFFSTAGGLHTQDLRLAFGFGARMNLGYFIIRYDFGQQTNLKKNTSTGQHFLSFGADF